MEFLSLFSVLHMSICTTLYYSSDYDNDGIVISWIIQFVDYTGIGIMIGRGDEVQWIVYYGLDIGVIMV